MAKLYNLARMTTATTGTGTITLGSAVSGFLTFALAGVADGDEVTYAISDGSSSEIGRGTYTASGTTLTRTVLASTNSNAAITLSGSAEVIITAAAEDIQAPPRHGQCQLTLSAGSLKLSPYNGNGLQIAGALFAVPDAGITLAATGLTASTLYYIYAYMNSGTMTLEASTTVPVADTTSGNKGVQIKTGANTRSLVGMAYVVTGPAFADSETQRLVRSWFNRQAGAINGPNMTATRTTTSTTYAELNSETRAEFLIWSGETFIGSTCGFCWSSTTDEVGFAVGVDGATTHTEGSSVYGTEGASAASTGPITGLSTGYHYATFLGTIDSGSTANYQGSSASDAKQGCNVAGWII